MPPIRLRRALIAGLLTICLPLVLIPVVSAALDPRAYLPIIMSSGAAPKPTPTTTLIPTATSAPGPSATPSQPSATPSSNSPIPAFSHVFTIVLENEDYESIIGDTTNAPYINSLAQQYAVAANYYGIVHPSLPNYIAMISGDMQGISNNCTDCFVDAPNIVDQLEVAGKSWKASWSRCPSMFRRRCRAALSAET